MMNLNIDKWWLHFAAPGIVILSVFVGCDGNSSNPARKSTAGSSAPQDSEEIVPGFGTESCHIGMYVEAVTNRFGMPDRVDAETGPNRPFDSQKAFYDDGISIVETDGVVETIAFWYVSKDLALFKGTAARGVNPQSTMSDVKNKYGDPSEVSDSRFSEFGEWPGKTETSIYYDALGIGFHFVDSNLRYVVVFKPRR